MIVEFMSEETITAIPYRAFYDDYLIRMSADEIAAIMAKLDEMIDGDEIHTAGWMPGNDWRGTVFHPIFEKAARRSYEGSAKCFGLMVWVAFMNRPEAWMSGRFELDGADIGSRTYFQPRSGLSR